MGRYSINGFVEKQIGKSFSEVFSDLQGEIIKKQATTVKDPDDQYYKSEYMNFLKGLSFLLGTGSIPFTADKLHFRELVEDLVNRSELTPDALRELYN